MAIQFEDFFQPYSETRVIRCGDLNQNPPSADFPADCPHFSTHYQNLLQDPKQKLILQSAYWLTRFYTAPLLSQSYDLSTQFRFWGHIAPNKDAAQRQLLILNSLIFQFTHLGNSHTRASYSALRLFEVLQNSDLKFYVKSIKAHNHIVVYIKHHQNWYIYDPMLNPDLIFSIKEYRQSVIKNLPVNEEKTPEIQQRIQQTTYFASLEKSHLFRDYLQEHIKKENPGHVLANPYYRSYFQHIPLGALEDITEKAIKKLKYGIAHPNPTPSFKNQ